MNWFLYMYPDTLSRTVVFKVDPQTNSLQIVTGPDKVDTEIGSKHLETHTALWHSVWEAQLIFWHLSLFDILMYHFYPLCAFVCPFYASVCFFFLIVHTHTYIFFIFIMATFRLYVHLSNSNISQHFNLPLLIWTLISIILSNLALFSSVFSCPFFYSHN